MKYASYSKHKILEVVVIFVVIIIDPQPAFEGASSTHLG